MEGFGTYRLGGARLCYRPPLPRLEAVWDPLERAARAVDAFDAALTAFPVADVGAKLLDRLGALLAEWRRRTTAVRAHSVVRRLVPWVLTTPKFSIAHAMAASGQSFASIANAVERLAGAGIVTQADGGARHRLFVAPEVISLFEANYTKAGKY